MALLWLHTRTSLWWRHTITIHSLLHSHTLMLGWVGRCPDKVSPQWALEVNYCLRVETWPDNLNAAGSGLSKTTVSFPAHTHTHTPYAHTRLLFYHLYFQFTLICWLFAFYNYSLSAPSSVSTTSVSLPSPCFSPLLLSQQLWPLSCGPFTSLWLPSPVPAVNSWGSWKHKHAQAWDEQLSHDRPLLTTTAPTTTTTTTTAAAATSLSQLSFTQGVFVCVAASQSLTSDLLLHVYLHHRYNSWVCVSSCFCQSADCGC